ncbi:UDP-N-acetylmuramoyl-tripeptide--D-alanyl-D-alanine ligase [Paenisporosarcina quisquiliarum]|uniref:UDP-N-acetylmuramoyl-tripeptide--D-alanyl-D-alanine ligase n=1 Tax=Paenisporosarcina quisquiliarum TaxID=365346 RepID=A0A9X3LES8_9BACL|nr:UDP-N-acetylmuramoyl-tripeptide--D-alanyl-D-alanine ligase [Paenisporosarcina quisquiliarum]MCZ8536708.1 UDP-N-acetylmuramoyl-tripeptide--D-alanyl-D-alanine ligase [Paenisporosarcina quisquiliarum]
MKKSLRTVAEWLNINDQEISDVTVSGVSINTKTIQPGDLFIPFKGEKVNGHQYVTQAFEKGASAALWQKDEPNPPQNLPLLLVEDSEKALQEMARAYRKDHPATFIGITGSNGKTSTKDLVAGVLSPYFRVQKTAGNFNNNLGLPITILSLDEETEFAILEMGMSGFGEIEFLSNLAQPHHVAITNIGEAHMQDLGSREGIAKAKFEIVSGLQDEGCLFYDGDEPLLKPFIDQFNGEKGSSSIRTVSFGTNTTNDISAQSIQATENGSEFDVAGLIDSHFMIPVLGKHQVKNALVAILIAKEAGLTNEQILESLKNVSLTDMRMQVIPAQNGALFINDAYNAAPTSMSAAITFIRETSIRSEKWLVLGDMLELGSDEQAYHEELAEQIKPEDFEGVCLYGPRMKWLYEKLQNTFGAPNLIWSEKDYAPIRDVLENHTSANSIILVKGSRGMALEHVIN